MPHWPPLLSLVVSCGCFHTSGGTFLLFFQPQPLSAPTDPEKSVWCTMKLPSRLDIDSDAEMSLMRGATLWPVERRGLPEARELLLRATLPAGRPALGIPTPFDYAWVMASSSLAGSIVP
jgi:hypothetical protein